MQRPTRRLHAGHGDRYVAGVGLLSVTFEAMSSQIISRHTRCFDVSSQPPTIELGVAVVSSDPSADVVCH